MKYVDDIQSAYDTARKEIIAAMYQFERATGITIEQIDMDRSKINVTTRDSPDNEEFVDGKINIHFRYKKP